MPYRRIKRRSYGSAKSASVRKMARETGMEITPMTAPAPTRKKRPPTIAQNRAEAEYARDAARNDIKDARGYLGENPNCQAAHIMLGRAQFWVGLGFGHANAAADAKLGKEIDKVEDERLDLESKFEGRCSR